MEEKREGPKITTSYSCFGCKYETSKRYSCQGDSGQDVYCHHLSFENKKVIGDTTWSTPKFCPFLNI